jgi:hypothetical protein
MLERVQNTAQSLLNQIPRRSSTTVDGYGCLSCGLVYSVDVYAIAPGDALDGLTHCPFCGAPRTKHLGTLPSLVEDEGKYFLMDDEGFGTGPYDDETAARNGLIDWFKGKEQHAREKERGGRLILLRNLPRAEEAPGRRPKEGDQNREDPRPAELEGAGRGVCARHADELEIPGEGPGKLRE